VTGPSEIPKTKLFKKRIYSMLSFFNFLIRWSFYALFALIPVIFTSNTSELFEFNKMWLTFGLTLVIAASWIGKMILERQIKIKRTPLDIPILLFLISQLIATIFSMNPHVSWWGYYSRFNGGMLSLLAYAFLYVAFVSNSEKKDLFKLIYVTIASGIFVALWGLPSHFGYDPTCLVFRGSLDVSCWTFAFQPKVRIFSTLGQPDWLAAYLVYLIPLTTAFGLWFEARKQKIWSYAFLAITFLFYLDLLYTRARSGFVGIAVAMVIVFGYYIAVNWKSFVHKSLLKSAKKHAFFLLTILVFAVSTFVVGSPFSQLDRISLPGVISLLQNEKQAAVAKIVPTPTPAPTQELGGTDSGKIRLFVWQGAWKVFLHNPLFGTGVETFAYAYYQYRPAGHNMTSEWDYLYNKAHNEYLNYLATTGAVGLLTYLFMLGYFLFVAVRNMQRDSSQMQNQKLENRNKHLQSAIINDQSSTNLLIVGLLAGYVSILATNFFGFSVVIMNIFLFLTPAWVFFLDDSLTSAPELAIPATVSSKRKETNEMQWIGISAVGLILLYCLVVLIRYYMADISYAMGQHLDQANEYQAAYSYLHDAVATRPSEPTFQQELTINDAVLAVALAQQKDAANAAKLAQEAIQVSDNLAAQYPTDITMWKTRVRVFYTLSQVNTQYLALALSSIQKAAQLAPTDAKVWYNLGLLYGQTGNMQKAVETLHQTTVLKPDYREAYYAEALFYRQMAIDKNNKIINPTDEQKAVDLMHYIVKTFGPSEDLKISQTLNSWGEK